MTTPDDHKYITFRRDEFHQLLGTWSTQDFREQSPVVLLDAADEIEIKDSVVIRRQDYFASPALAGYSAAIAIALRCFDSSDIRHKQLLAVADYFQRQSELAAEEGWKLPDV